MLLAPGALAAQLIDALGGDIKRPDRIREQVTIHAIRHALCQWLELVTRLRQHLDSP
ncbi:MAG: hypothetical protein GY867_12455 [bacterium]|nr:hypothetical protein [bacterium]